MEPTDAGRSRRALIGSAAVALVASLLSSGSAVASSGPETVVTMISETHELILRGEDRVFHAGNAAISASGSEVGVSVTANDPATGHTFTFSFAPARGQVLRPGAYENAVHPVTDPARPKIQIGGGGRGCTTAAVGRFLVKELSFRPEGGVDSLSISYEYVCDRRTQARLIGELRYNSPGDGGGVLVAPRQIRWPDTELGARALPIPITVLNPQSSGNVGLGASSLSGYNPSSFALVDDGCDGKDLGPGASCRVLVQLLASQVGAAQAELRIPERGGAVHVVALRGTIFDGVTRFVAQGTSGDPITDGRRVEFDPSVATIRAAGDGQFVSVAVVPEDGPIWSLYLDAPDGDALAAGRRFEDAVRYPYNEAAAGLSLSRTGLYCDAVDGWFEIHHLAFDADGGLVRLSVTFEQSCNASPPLYGVVDFRAPSQTPWPDPGPTEVSPTATSSPSPTPSPTPTETSEPPPLHVFQNQAGLDTDISVDGSNRAWTYAPVTQISRPRVMFRNGAGRRVRVSSKRSIAWAGSLHGSKLVYQQRRRARSVNSQIRLYNTRRGKHRGLPNNVNTRNFEWAPVVYGRWLGFTRIVTLASGQDRSMLSLVNLKTGKKEIVESRQDTGNSIRAGQMSGRYLTWERCTPQCEVLTYNRATSRKVWMPKPRNGDLPNSDLYHYAPSVLKDGTTFFARSLIGCGNDVSLYMRPAGGPNELLFDLPADTDLDGTWATTRPDGGVRLFLDLIRCRRDDYGIYYVDLPS